MTQEQEKDHFSERGEWASSSGVGHSPSVTGEAWTGEDENKLSDSFAKNSLEGARENVEKMHASLITSLSNITESFHFSDQRHIVLIDWTHLQKKVLTSEMNWLVTPKYSKVSFADSEREWPAKPFPVITFHTGAEPYQSPALFGTMLKAALSERRANWQDAQNPAALTAEMQQAMTDMLANEALRKASSDFYAQQKRETGLTAAQRYAEAKRLHREQKSQ